MAELDSDATLEATAVPPAPAGTRAPSSGTRIGRFVVLETIGQGAMGIVLAAYDADLDRKVAIKLVKNAATAPPEQTKRMLREAQAMAKVSHPNVLAIHEVGTFGDQVFLATEFATGGTLRAWLDARRRTWREIVPTLLAAARGLEAAHRAGLVHRDFKPDNVLMMASGDVKVADFGIVGAQHELPAGERPALGANRPSLMDLTQTGTLLGTPAYMAPEQHRSEPAGPAADQFAFCVTLWEALYGTRPFTGASYAELATAVLDEQLAEPPTDREVPAWLHELVRRGLRADPAERWPSMAALIEALGADPDARRRRRVRAAAGGALVLALGGITIASLAAARRSDGPQCAGLEHRLVEIWSPARAGALRARFEATKRPDAGELADRVTRQLGHYADAWLAARRDACEATNVRHEQSAELMDLRMACLDRRLDELGELTKTLLELPEPAVLDRAVEAASGLAPVAECADGARLRAVAPLPATADARREAQELATALARAKVLHDTGQYRGGLELARGLVERARGLEHAPLVAEALVVRARLESSLGTAREAEATLEDAIRETARAHDDVLAARAWALLVYVVGDQLRRPDEALRLRLAAEAALARAGNERAAEYALRNNLGNVYLRSKRHADARQQHARAIELAVEGTPGHALSLSNLGLVAKNERAYDEAQRLHERALAIRQQVLGERHPDTAKSLVNLGSVLRRRGQLDAARDHFERALAIQRAAMGDDTVDAAVTLDQLCEVARAQAQLDTARPLCERALAIRERHLGPTHALVASTLTDVALVALAQGRLDDALRDQDRALAIRERAGGPDEIPVGSALVRRADVLAARGDRARSLADLRRAIAIAELRRDPDLATAAHAARADVLLASGEVASARAAAEQALRDEAPEPGSVDEDVERARFALARALAASDRPRALELATRARDRLATLGLAGRVAELERWIAGQR